ncbi:hypothetical protein FHR87_002706 [Azomonas macrocytogenes]|uniref:Integrase n=1 Tax=Azomonas macrocytogenes TaxID=69962 RepID=A0A839T431_AZOMA|nr:hypothetical protein [Azomonas macrocytogenes]MBB3104291.1 hypothetical protein [Azomonas macrocytogenes]
MSGALARQKAAELRTESSVGANPIETKQARKQAQLLVANSTFELLAREWIEIRLPGWELSTVKRTIGALERVISARIAGVVRACG